MLKCEWLMLSKIVGCNRNYSVWNGLEMYGEAVNFVITTMHCWHMQLLSSPWDIQHVNAFLLFCLIDVIGDRQVAEG